MKRLAAFASFLVAVLLVIPLGHASLSSNMEEIGSYVDDYNRGELGAARLMVYVEYTKNKMYEELDKEHKKAFHEDDIKQVFDPIEQEDFHDKMFEGPIPIEIRGGGPFEFKTKARSIWHSEPEFQKVFPTDDFELVFTATSFYRHDREYYESREDESAYYMIDYYLEPLASAKTSGDVEEDIKGFIDELKSAVEHDDYDKMEEAGRMLSELKWEVREASDCDSIMGSVLEKDEERSWGDSNFYTLRIKEDIETNCWEDSECQKVCEPETNCWQNCNNYKQVCEESCETQCQDEEVCDEICENVTSGNETVQECHTGNCTMQEVCEDSCSEFCWDEPYCEEVCDTWENCFDECKPVERCDNWTNGEISVEGACGKDRSDLYVNIWGQNFEKYRIINQFHEERDCTGKIESLVKMRQAFQESMDNEFARWYFEDFLGSDPEKIVNGESGFRKILEILTRNEEDISNNLFCSEITAWPEGFESIDVTYRNNNTNVEVWEKRIPVEGSNIKHWTTLYKYSWVPSRDMLKDMIQYKLSEQDTLGPSAKDVARIKADAGKMEIIDRLAGRYGGSFDVNIEMIDENNTVVRKYMHINPDVAIEVSDNTTEKEDITITIDYNVLYDFINYMSFTMEGDEIRGPNWVYLEEGGPGKFFSVIGALSKFWREGVEIKPRRALFKLFFSTGDVVSLIKG